MATLIGGSIAQQAAQRSMLDAWGDSPVPGAAFVDRFMKEPLRKAVYYSQWTTDLADKHPAVFAMLYLCLIYLLVALMVICLHVCVKLCRAIFSRLSSPPVSAASNRKND